MAYLVRPSTAGVEVGETNLDEPSPHRNAQQIRVPHLSAPLMGWATRPQAEAPHDVWQIIAHESGHTTVQLGGTRKTEAEEHAEGGLMMESLNLGEWTTDFTPATLLRFRSVERW